MSSQSDPQSSRQETVVQLIAGHQTRLRAFVRCLLFDGHDVDDVLQETNRVLWQKSEQFEPGTDFWAWAAQIARFEVLSHIKRRRRVTQLFDSEVVSDLATVAEQHLQSVDERRSALEQCLERQPSTNRQLLELRYAVDRPLQTIAEQLDRPVGSIRQTLYRIRGALLKCIERLLASGDPA